MTTHIYYSNTIEKLAEQFARDILMPGADPLKPPLVIVPNPHLKKWLQLTIAGINGIAANCDFQFLDRGLWKIIAKLSGTENPAPSILTQEELRLLVFHVLDSDMDSSDLAPLKSYFLNSDGTRKTNAARRIWRLSERLARIFSGYELYRESMLRAWKDGETLYGTPMESAQKHLYSAIFGDNGLSRVIKPGAMNLWEFIGSAVIDRPDAEVPSLYLFGKSQLSPMHTRILYELGKKTDLFLYQLNPCSEFWEDVTTPGEERWERIRKIPIMRGSEGESLEYDENENPLLKMWGKSGRETTKLLSMIEEAGSREEWLVSEWLTPDAGAPAGTVLATLQEHILRRSSGGKGVIIPQDRSLQVSACPDIYREAEGVYNSILYNLDRDPSLAMTDIAVMAPDMDMYGPVLEAVFSRRPKRIAFSMIDRSADHDSIAARAVRSILAIASGSFSREEVFGLIMNPCFLEASGSSSEEAELWFSWTDRLNIFSGYDTTDRDTPGSGKSYTWQHGMQRLRLGRIMDIPMTGGDSRAFLDYSEIVPFSDMSTGNDDQTGRFGATIDMFYRRIRTLRDLRAPAGEWASLLQSLLRDFIAVPAGMEEEALVLSNLDHAISLLKLLDRLRGTEAGREVALEFISEYITDSISSIPGSRGSYLTSGVNISSLVPKRQIPFRIIYIMGMQEGLFPGTADLSTLDLRNFMRTIGDISKPDANRYLFLETLISIRDRLYITYTAKDLKKDQDFYPNSIVSQLIDYVSSRITGSDFIISTLPLSGSSPGYLHASGPHTDFFSLTDGGAHMPVNYSESDMLLMYLIEQKRQPEVFDAKAAKTILSRMKTLAPDFTLPSARDIPSPGSVERISIRELARFLSNPVESVIQRHLGLYDRDRDTISIEKEEPLYSGFPFDMDIVRSALSHHVLNPEDDIMQYIGRYYESARMRGETPDGAFADIDSRYFTASISDRLAGGLSDLVEDLHKGALYRDPSFGSDPYRPGGECSVDPVTMTVSTGDREVLVEISGSVRYIFKNAPGDECRILVLTNSADFRIKTIIEPFLFYMTARSGLQKDLADLFGRGRCTIHVSHRKGVESFSYGPGQEDARSFLEGLVRDFLDQGSLDMLPVDIAGDAKRLMSPVNMREGASPAEKMEYRSALIDAVRDAVENRYTFFNASDVLADLIEPEVPADAYDKVLRRFAILFGPVHQEEQK